jgi:hypothetical protein
MKKLFVVTSNATTEAQDAAFHEWYSTRFNWWHWLGQTWLLIDENGTYSAGDIRDEFRKCAPDTYVLIVQGSGAKDWAGYGPNSDTDANNNMFAWIHEYWKS